MAPPLQAPRPKLHHVVPPRRHNPHQPPYSILSLLSPLPLPLHCPSPTRPKPQRHHPTRRSPAPRLRPHRPSSKHLHPTPRLHPPPSQNSIPPSLKTSLQKKKQTNSRHRALLMNPGLTGNAILNSSLQQMREGGLEAEGKVYCHPIGDWGHSARSLIGMMGLQGGGSSGAWAIRGCWEKVVGITVWSCVRRILSLR